MSLLLNLRHLEKGDVRLKGELAAGSLDLEGVDELIQVDGPLKYALEAQKLDRGILVQGRLDLKLKCGCARCLKPFAMRIDFQEWSCHLPLEGDERVPVSNECVDLTPYLREDILLEFPQHPLCEPGCRGLTKQSAVNVKKTSSGEGEAAPSAWAELKRLKF